MWELKFVAYMEKSTGGFPIWWETNKCYFFTVFFILFFFSVWLCMCADMLFNCGSCLYCVVTEDFFFFLENHTLCSLIMGRYKYVICNWMAESPPKEKPFKGTSSPCNKKEAHMGLSCSGWGIGAGGWHWPKRESFKKGCQITFH